ncbi:MAG: hypothetical protein A2W99_10220 [Bacteroidetes bacterium GWF2_33_16]|nr:MAG: hypothetical protein A2X00_05520 [Bacteroidetes bacterium GWE2_32_14]OFY03923.1 MAG: hypothetical protein A2W99_10220 [Bacteroidetes bacterium GWF2_33_16]
MFGQDGEQKIPDLFDVFPVSPEAASLGSYGNVPVNLSSGQLNIEIPLYTIKLKGIEIPIALSYNYSGFKVTEESGVFGLGWTFVGGGVITRQLNGRPDEDQNGYIGRNRIGFNYVLGLKEGELNDEKLSDLVINSASGRWDTQPDQFILSAPYGINGIFYFDVYAQPVFIPHKNFKVEIPFYGEPYYNIIDLIVTDDQGIRYTFSESELTLRDGGDDIPGYYISNYKSSWQLTEIFNLKTNEKIQFRYINYNYSPKTIYSQTLSITKNLEGSNKCMGNVDDSKSEQVVSITGKLLDSIIFPGGTIKFEREVINNILQKEVKRINIENNTEAISGYIFNYNTTNNSNIRTLTNIKKVSNNNLEEDYYNFAYHNNIPSEFESGMSIQFAQDFWGYYTGKSNPDLLNFGNRKPDFEMAKAGALKEIEYPTKGKTEIEYESNTANCYLYNPLTEEKKGYILSESLSELRTPIVYKNGLKLLDGIGTLYDTLEIPLNSSAEFSCLINLFGQNAEVEISVSPIEIYSSLIGYVSGFQDYESGESILNPILRTENGKLNPGKYIIYFRAKCSYVSGYDYKANILFTIKYFDQDEIEIGGIRVKRTKNYTDLNSTSPSLVKNYSYKWSNFTSSGLILRPGIYKYKTYTKERHIDPTSGWEIWYTCETENSFSSSVVPWLYYQGNPVLYKRVEEFSNNEGATGKTIYKYTGDPSLHNFVFPFPPIQDPNWKLGLVEQETQFKKVDLDFEKIKENNKSYASYWVSDDLLGVYSKKYINGDNNDLREYYKFGIYAFTPISYVMTKKVEKEYFYSETIETKQTYIYDKSKSYIKEKTNFLNGIEKTKSIYYYPSDFNNSVYNVSDLKGNNILSIPIRKEFYKDSKLISGIISLYNNNGSVKEVYSLEKNVPLSPVDFNGDLLFNFPEYIRKGKYIYNTNNTILLGAQKEDQPEVSVIWGYNDEYPIIKAENLSYINLNTAVNAATNNLETLLANIGDMTTPEQKNQWEAFNTNLRNNSLLVNSLITTYTYKPLVGVTSETDTCGRTIYYLYDGFGRLKEVRDHDYNVIKQYEYHYGGEQ